ncbi:hypothetical protein [Methylocystis sp. S23]
MANTEGPEGQPPAAWVWSQYRGVQPAEPPAAEAPAEEVAAPSAEPLGAPEADAPVPARNSSLIGLGLAAAVIVIAGLTWLFTTKPASGPTLPETPPTAEAPAQKSEAAPPAPAPDPAASATPAAAAPAQEAPKPAEPAPAHGKKKKHR